MPYEGRKPWFIWVVDGDKKYDQRAFYMEISRKKGLIAENDFPLKTTTEVRLNVAQLDT
jgi:hypothetical protein